MLETEIKKLTAAITELTAKLNSAAAADPIPASEVPAAAVTAAPSSPAPVTTEPVADAPAVAAQAEPTATPVTKKQLVEKFIELAEAKGRDIATGLLAEYKIVKLPELKDQALWPAFYTKCQELING